MDLTNERVILDQLDTVITQQRELQEKVNELHQFAQQLINAMEQFQAGGFGKMIAGMMGGRNGR